MRLLLLCRLVITLLVIGVSVIYLENKRMANNFPGDRKSENLEAKGIRMSNTDFIFFESLSKYLFISFTQ